MCTCHKARQWDYKTPNIEYFMWTRRNQEKRALFSIILFEEGNTKSP